MEKAAKDMMNEVKEQQTDVPLPPRRKVHPSNKMKMIRLFYNILVTLFLLLTAGLIVWGFTSWNKEDRSAPGRQIGIPSLAVSAAVHPALPPSTAAHASEYCCRNEAAPERFQ